MGQTALPYNAKTLSNTPELIGIPVKDAIVVVTKNDYAAFLDAAKISKNSRPLSSVGEFATPYVLVREDPNGGRLYVMFFRAVVLSESTLSVKLTPQEFSLVSDSIVLHEVRGGRLSAKASLLRHKANLVASSLRRLRIA